MPENARGRSTTSVISTAVEDRQAFLFCDQHQNAHSSHKAEAHGPCFSTRCWKLLKIEMKEQLREDPPLTLLYQASDTVGTGSPRTTVPVVSNVHEQYWVNRCLR